MVKGLAKGSAAEYLLVDGEACARKPPNVSFDHAASVSLVAATAVLAFRTCGLQEIGASRRDGPRVLITRGSGGCRDVCDPAGKGDVWRKLCRHDG